MTARGNNRQAIYEDDRDRLHFIDLIGAMVERYRVRMHAYVLMTNHYHLLIETPEANVSQVIQWLNVSYSVWFRPPRYTLFQNVTKISPEKQEHI